MRASILAISLCQKFLTRNSLFLLETHFSYSKLAFLTRKSLFLLGTHFSYSKLAFLTRNSLFLPELTFLARNSLFLLETHFYNSKLAFLTRNSLFLLESHYLLIVNHPWWASIMHSFDIYAYSHPMHTPTRDYLHDVQT